MDFSCRSESSNLSLVDQAGKMEGDKNTQIHTNLDNSSRQGQIATILTTSLPVSSKELLGGNASSHTKIAQDADMEYSANAKNAGIDTLM